MSSVTKRNDPQSASPIEHPAFVIVSAAPGSGKSYLIKYLIMQMATVKAKKGAPQPERIQYGVVFSPNLSGKDVIEEYDYIPQKCHYKKYTDDRLNHIMKFQEKYNKPMFIIFDDCTNLFSTQSKAFSLLATSYRHKNITVFFTSHLLTKMSTLCRDCMTNLFLFKQESGRSYEAIWRDAMQDLKEKDAKALLIKSTARPHQYLRINMRKVGFKEKYVSSWAPQNYPQKNMALDY